MKKKDFINELIKIFDKEYPDAECSLTYNNPLELLIATQLSAQCRDERVNVVTKDLFSKYKTCDDYANADVKDIENIIKSLGLYKNKAKNIIACCKKISENFNGEVPDTMEEILTLDGVGRKTANLVLGDAFSKPAVVVDTHAIRLTNRMKLVKTKDPYKIELELKKIVPEENQSRLCHQLVLHGRKYCDARKPNCESCPVKEICPKNIKEN